MSDKNKPSGAEYRKRKKGEMEKIAKLPKLDKFFIKPSINEIESPSAANLLVTSTAKIWTSI